VTLFWSLFGLTQLGSVREGNIQTFTKRVGEYMLMCYHAMAVIVLVNMLIAMMSNSFQEIEVLSRHIAIGRQVAVESLESVQFHGLDLAQPHVCCQIEIATGFFSRGVYTHDATFC
jgi:hypothetical protein